MVDNTICIISKTDKDKITFKTIENHQYGLRKTVSKHLKGRGKIRGARIGRAIIRGNKVIQEEESPSGTEGRRAQAATTLSFFNSISCDKVGLRGNLLLASSTLSWNKIRTRGAFIFFLWAGDVYAVRISATLASTWNPSCLAFR